MFTNLGEILRNADRKEEFGGWSGALKLRSRKAIISGNHCEVGRVNSLLLI